MPVAAAYPDLDFPPTRGRHSHPASSTDSGSVNAIVMWATEGAMPVGNMEEHKQRIVVETQGWLLSVKVLVGEIQDRDIVKDGSQPVARPFPDLELLRADGRHDRNLVGGPRSLDIFLKDPQVEREWGGAAV